VAFQVELQKAFQDFIVGRAGVDSLTHSAVLPQRGSVWWFR
jgi:hypothetical protein